MTNEELIDINKQLTEAAKAAIKCIAGLAPFPVGDPSDSVAEAISQVGDEADLVIVQLRKAIKRATS